MPTGLVPTFGNFSSNLRLEKGTNIKIHGLVHGFIIFRSSKGGPDIPAGGGGGAAASALGSLLAAGALAYGAYNSIYTVDGGHRAIIFNRLVGMKNIVYGEGLNFNIPWFEWPVIFDIRTRPRNLQTLTDSKDLQMVEVGVRVLHRPDPVKLVWMYHGVMQGTL